MQNQKKTTIINYLGSTDCSHVIVTRAEERSKVSLCSKRKGVHLITIPSELSSVEASRTAQLACLVEVAATLPTFVCFHLDGICAHSRCSHSQRNQLRRCPLAFLKSVVLQLCAVANNASPRHRGSCNSRGASSTWKIK